METWRHRRSPGTRRLRHRADRRSVSADSARGRRRSPARRAHPRRCHARAARCRSSCHMGSSQHERVRRDSECARGRARPTRRWSGCADCSIGSVPSPPASSRSPAIAGAPSSSSRCARRYPPGSISESARRNATWMRRIAKTAADMIVPFEQFGEMMQIYRTGFSSLGLDYAIWGHVSDGNVHPNVIPRSYDDVEKGTRRNPRVRPRGDTARRVTARRAWGRTQSGEADAAPPAVWGSGD